MFSSVSGDFVVNIDLAETLLDFASDEMLPGIQGRSIRPILRGKTPKDWRYAIYYRSWMHRAHFNIPAHLEVRTRNFKLIYYYGQSCGKKGALSLPSTLAWELFDLEKDPNEINNLYTDPNSQATIQELKRRLKDLQHQYDDEDACGRFDLS